MDKTKILIIDPDHSQAMEMSGALKSGQIEPVLVHSHFKALTILEDERFPMILVSADASGIDGLEFCRIFNKRQMESGRDFSYLILVGHSWQRVHICEGQALAHDFLVRPYLSCELRWRVASGLTILKEMSLLKDLIYLDPETGTLNQTGLKKVLKEEVNRLGRKKGWLSVAVLDFRHRDWMEVSQGSDVLLRSQKMVLKFLKRSLRDYDHVSRTDQGRICILSGDCDYHSFTGLLSRVNDSLNGLQIPLIFQPDSGARLTGIFQSIKIDLAPEGCETCFNHLWKWIESVRPLPEHEMQGGISFLDREGLRDMEQK